MAEAVSPDMNQKTQSLLDVSYQLALGQAFLVDDVNDGQVANVDVKLIPALKEVEVSVAAAALGWPDAKIAFEWSGTQAQALEVELQRYSSRQGYVDEENVLGRSAPVLSYFEAIARHGVAIYASALKPLLMRYLIVAQRCDDLSDWEDDLLQGRYTPVVQSFLEQSGSSIAEYGERFYPEVLRSVYLEGLLLRELNECHRELLDITSNVRKISGTTEKMVSIIVHLHSIVKENIDKISQQH
nr:hypothetical protein [Streptomyces sp. 846.5]